MFDNFDLTTFAHNHWPFLAVALALGIFGEMMKRLVIPNGSKGLTGWRWWWNWSLPFHAALAGFMIGMLPFMTCPVAVCRSLFERGLYYSASGMLSSYVYALLKHVAKEKLGSDAPTPSLPPT